jgi:predicted RNase H-like HicB family nuclease
MPTPHISQAVKAYTVTCQWDAEAGVWYVADSDVPGLVTEAATLEALESKLLVMIPELLELNDGLASHQAVPFELIARKRELAQRA